MPGKTRRQRKSSGQVKRKPVTRPAAAAVESQPGAVQPAQAARPARQPAAPVRQPETVIARNPYIARELWTIGVLATVMLVILIVLAAVIP